MARRTFDRSTSGEGNVIDMKTGKPVERPTLPVICERIRYYREKQGIDQKTMASKLGITANSISNWENGRSRPDVNLLPAICKVLEISLLDLYGIDGSVSTITPKQQSLIEKYEMLSDGHQLAVENLIDNLIAVEKSDYCPDLKVLMYFNRSLAAGIGDPTEFDEDAELVYVYSTAEVNRADSIFKINGDSMEPVFSDGQEVLVQRLPWNHTLNPGEIGAFMINNETYIKRYEKDGLHSLNPDYPVMHFDDEQSVYLIGKVLGVFDPSSYAKQSDIERYKLLHQ